MDKTRHTCIVDDRLFEAVNYEDIFAESEANSACELCAAEPGSELCHELADCCINGAYHYWHKVEGLEAGEPLHFCGSCACRDICPCGSDPMAHACAGYEQAPDLSGCCAAALMILGFFGFIACLAVRGAANAHTLVAMLTD